jgi:hypothetical protein
MNSLRIPRVSTCARWPRAASTSRPAPCSATAMAFLQSLGFDLVLVETAGIGQSDSEIVDLVDLPVYVMTSEYGAPSQLEKIDMIDFAELIVLNKFDKRGAEDALRDVRKQWKRNHQAFTLPDEQVPVYPTIASQFNDPGIAGCSSTCASAWREKLARPARAWTASDRHHAARTARHGADSGQRARATSPRSPSRAAASMRAGRNAGGACRPRAAPVRGAEGAGRQSGTAGSAGALCAERAHRCRRRPQPARALRQRYKATLEELGAEGRSTAARLAGAPEGHHRRPSSATKCAARRSAATTTATS